jgi:hypothetical protein
MSQYAIANIRIPLKIVGSNYEILNERIHIDLEPCNELPEIQPNMDSVAEQMKLLFSGSGSGYQEPTNTSDFSNDLYEDKEPEPDKEPDKEPESESEPELKSELEPVQEHKYILSANPTIPRNRLNITFKKRLSKNNLTRNKYHL